MVRKKNYYCGLLAVSLFIAIIRLFICSEICLWDEMQYCVNSLQICNGSRLLIDDWNVTQLSGIISYPLVALFLFLNHSTEGIILYLRFCNIVIKFLIFVWAKRRLQSKGIFNTLSFGGLIIFLMYSPFNIVTVSYNTITLNCATILLILVYTVDEKNMVRDSFVTGIVLAIMSFAHPYCSILFIPLVIELIVVGKMHKRFGASNQTGVIIGAFIFGGLLVTLYGIIVVLHNSSITEVLKNISYIIESPDHDMASSGALVSIVHKTLVYAKVFLLEHIWITITGCIILLLGLFIQKKPFCKLVPISIMLLAMIGVLFDKQVQFKQNGIFIPCIWLAMLLVLTKKNRRDIIAIINCLVVTWGVFLGSNTMMITTSSFYVLFIIIVLFSLANDYKLDYCKNTIILSIVVVTFICLLSIFVEWKSQIKVSEYSDTINSGPLKYMLMTNDDQDSYYKQLEDMNKLELNPKERILCVTYYPLAYVFLNRDIGGTFFFVDIDRVKMWLELNKDYEFSYLCFRKDPAYSTEKFVFTDETRDFLSTYWEKWRIIETDTAYFIKIEE